MHNTIDSIAVEEDGIYSTVKLQRERHYYCMLKVIHFDVGIMHFSMFLRILQRY